MQLYKVFKYEELPIEDNGPADASLSNFHE